MESITTLFADIIDLQKNIGYNMADYLLPGLSIQELKKHEEVLGLKFTDEIFELYSITGGIDSNIRISMGYLELLPMNILANFEYIHHYQTILPVINTDHPDFYPNGIKLFFLLYDGGSGKDWVDLNIGNYYGHVLNDFGGGVEPYYTFNSIKSYLYFVKQCYTQKLVFLDEDGCLEWDFDKFQEYKKHYLTNQIL